jgi:hypothetical protein
MTTKKSKDTACANGVGKAKPKSARSPAGEKARKAGIAEAEQRIRKIEAAEAAGSELVPTYPGADYAGPAPANHSEQHTEPEAPAQPAKPTPGLDALAGSELGEANKRSWENLPDHGRRDGSAKLPKARKPKAPKAEEPTGPMSGLDAAAKVLAEAGIAMNVKDLTDSILAQKLWFTDGKTPGATIYAAIIREIAAKGPDSRFRKTDRGLFEATEKGG